MNQEVETRSNRRRMILMLMAAAFLVWQVPAMDFFEKMSADTQSLRGLLSGAGFLFWAGGLVFLLASGRAARSGQDADVNSALEDELVQANRSKSFVVGYIGTLLAAGVLFALNLVVDMSGRDAAQLIMVIAVVTPMFAFVVLERSVA